MATAAYPVTTNRRLDELAARVRAGVARHGDVVLVGGRSQARQLRRLQAALRAGGYQARYFTDGSADHVLVIAAPGEEMPRVLGWWAADLHVCFSGYVVQLASDDPGLLHHSMMPAASTPPR